MAISAGCPANAPEYSSISFFNLFPKRLVEGRTVGLFAETLVPQDAFDRIKDRPGVKEAFAERKGINLVVTSMGDVRDEHDLLMMFLDQPTAQSLQHARHGRRHSPGLAQIGNVKRET